MTTLTAAQTLDMLGFLAAGALNDVFSQDELQRFFDLAAGDFNTAVYLGWLEILGNATTWVNYRVAQTQVSRGDAFDHIKVMLDIWQKLALTPANQLISAGIAPVPTRCKPRPGGDYRPVRGRNSSHANWRDW